MQSESPQRLKNVVLLIVIGITLITMLFVSPISQDPAYHRFADQRSLLGVPHFWNVVSNLPFLLVGLAGMYLLWQQRHTAMPLRILHWIFFGGVALVALGSSYYHLRPENQTLVWDRLPMTIAFMAFFTLVTTHCVNSALGRRMLLPLLIVGIFSVFYWHVTEQAGHGDLRLYALVQFLPMLLIPLMLLMFASRFAASKYIWWMLVAYVVSKLLEHFDTGIYQFLGGISGHSLKHLAAAVATGFFYLYLRQCAAQQHNTDNTQG